MSVLSLPNDTVQRLQDRAIQENVSIDHLINQWLNTQLAPNNSADLYKRLLEHTSDTVVLFDLDLRYRYANHAMQDLMGLSLADMLGKTDLELGMPEAQATQLKASWQEVIDAKTEQILRFDYKNAQGHRFYEARLNPIFDDSGAIEYLLAITRDITQHEETETALSKSRHNLNALIENSDANIWSVDTHYCLIVANTFFYQTLAKMLGRELLVGENLITLPLPQSNLDQWQSYYDRALRGEKFSIETFTYFADVRREMEYRFNPIKGDNNSISGVAVFTRDITEQKQAQEQLRRSEANLRAMLESTTQSFTLIDLNYCVIDIDEQGKKTSEIVFGKNVRIGDSIYDFVFPKDLDGFNENFKRAASGETVYLEKTFKNTEGETLYFEITYYPVIDKNGITIGVCMTNQNITVRKHAEEALRQSEERYRLLAENVTDMISRHTPDGIYTFVTPSTRTLLGYEPDELIGHSSYEFFHVDDLKAIQQAHQNIIQQPLVSTVEYRIRRKDGQYIWFETTSHLVLDAITGEQTEIVAVSRDISDRKHAEEALRQSEMRLRSLLETQSAFVIRTDIVGNITYVSPNWLEKFGWTDTKFIGDSSMKSIYYEDHEKTFQTVQQCMANPQQPVQVTLRKQKEDGSFVWTLWEFVALQDNMGKITEIQCMGFDVTQQIDAEHLRLEQERLKANLKKEREFNTLIQKAVSSLDHDIRTPLAVIGTSKNMLDHYFDRLHEDKRREKLDSIGRQLNYVVELLDNLTATIKGNLDTGAFNPVSINLEALCQICIQEIQETTGTNHHLTFVTDNRIVNATVDETLVSRILLNLLSNSVKYSPQNSDISLELNRREEWIVLRVVDHGMGISESDQNHIFEAFYRTDSAQHIHGTGLGLNIVKECVENHRGHITLQSELQKGTTFTVELPVLAV